MLIIFLNSVSLAVYDYADKSGTSKVNYIVNYLGYAFTILFTLEVIFRTIANGLWMHKRAYLRSGWNWLDLLVVIVGWLEIIPNIPNFRAIRTLRVLRPLRSINSIPILKKQVIALMKSLAQLANVLLFFLFFFVFFSIFGMDMYKGQYFQRCRYSPAPDEFGNWPVDESQGRLCSKDGNVGWFTCPVGEYCGAPQDFGLSLDNENLTQAAYANYGLVNFDNLAQGFNNIFQTITLENWSYTMYLTMDSGAPGPAIMFYLLTVFIGAYLLTNVILCIIVSNYSDTKNAEKQCQILDQSRILSSHSTDGDARSHDDLVNSFNSTRPLHLDIGLPLFLRKSTFRRDQETQAIPQKVLFDEERNKSFEKSPEGNRIREISFLQPNQSLISNDNELVIKVVQTPESSRQVKPSNEVHNTPSQQLSSLPLIERPRISKPIFDLQEVISNEGNANIMDDDFASAGSFDNDENGGTPLEVKQNTQGQVVKVNPNLEEDNTLDIKDFNSDTQKVPRKNCFGSFRNICLRISMKPIFANSVLVLIVFNTIILAMDRYPIDPYESYCYEQINTALTWVFFFEMLIKIIGMGPNLYLRDKVNIFDCLVVMLTTAENISGLIMSSQGGFTKNGKLAGFRAIRLFRFFKVASKMKGFQIMIEKIAVSMDDVGKFSILMFLFLFTMTLLGQELYAGMVKFDSLGNVDLVNGVSPRPNFDSFANGFIMVFLLMIGDNWDNYMYLFQIACGNSSSVYFVMAEIFGKHVLLNLFLAILLENFDDFDMIAEQTIDDTSSIDKKSSQMFGSIKKALTGNSNRNQAIAPECSESISNTGPNFKATNIHVDFEKTGIKLNLESDTMINSARAIGNNHISLINPQLHSNPYVKKNTTAGFAMEETQRISLMDGNEVTDRNMDEGGSLFQKQLDKQLFVVDSMGEEELQDRGEHFKEDSKNPDNSPYSIEGQSQNQTSNQHSATKKKKQNLMETYANRKLNSLISNAGAQLQGNSLYMFSPNNKFRVLAYKIVTHPFFDIFILAIIFVSTIMMAVDNPLNDPIGYIPTIVNQVDVVFTVIFCCEAILKIISGGLIINGKGSYLRIAWNVMDFFIVSFSILSIALSTVNIPFIKVLRMLRVFRPLRMISRNEGLKIVVISLFNSVPAIIDALLIVSVVCLLFSIFGTSYFKGKQWNCLMGNVQMTDPVITKWDCLNFGGDWVNVGVNFDNVPMALVSLFQLLSTESNAEILWGLTDSVDIDYQPQPEYQLAWAFFHIAFMIIGPQFILNLFVSIVVNSYYQEKEKLYNNDKLTKYQKVWLQVQTMCFQQQPVHQIIFSPNPFKNLCQKLALEDSWFDYLITTCILLNTVLMSIDWFEAPQQMLSAFEYINYIFIAIFTVEVIIKATALGGRGNFSKGWNIFDFIIVAISYATLILQLVATSSIGPKQTTIARTLRIARIFRLIAKAKFLRIIFNTIILTFPGLANVGSLMFLILYIFTILGVQMFAVVGLQSNLDYHGNFQYFGIALLTLIRLQSGEGWPDVMADLARQRQINFDCDYNPTYDTIQANQGIPYGCGTPFSYVFFCLFHFILPIIFMNLFIAVILNGFSDSSGDEGFENFKSILDQFKSIWKKYDPDATGFMPVQSMPDFIKDLENETEFITMSLKGSGKFMRSFIAHLQVPTFHQFRYYYFQDVLILLAKKYISHKYTLECLQNLDIQEGIDQVQEQKELRERQFEDEIDMIQVKSLTEKIQLIQENKKYTDRYHNRMMDKVDKFQGNVYDSSYIVWVPIIQSRLKPLLAKLKQDRQNQEQLRINASKNRLIIETGSQIAQGQNNYLTVNRRTSQAGNSLSPRQESVIAFPSIQSRSLNDEDLLNLSKNVRGQTTGEVGGTLFNLAEEDNSRLGIIQGSNNVMVHLQPEMLNSFTQE